MPDSANPLLVVARLAAAQTARALRLGAAVLDQLTVATDHEAPADAQDPEAAPRRPRRQASRAPKDLDDVTIARKVETELFRDRSVPKGDIDVNVADGVVFLRGQVRHPEDVRRLEEQARAIPEVLGVENLLHLHKTPAPTRTDTPDRQRKPAGRRTKPRSARLQSAPPPAPVHTEVPVPGAEPSPEALARAAKGRRPAPFGSAEAPGEPSAPAPPRTPDTA